MIFMTIETRTTYGLSFEKYKQEAFQGGDRRVFPGIGVDFNSRYLDDLEGPVLMNEVMIISPSSRDEINAELDRHRKELARSKALLPGMQEERDRASFMSDAYRAVNLRIDKIKFQNTSAAHSMKQLRYFFTADEAGFDPACFEYTEGEFPERSVGVDITRHVSGCIVDQDAFSEAMERSLETYARHDWDNDIFSEVDTSFYNFQKIFSSINDLNDQITNIYNEKKKNINTKDASTFSKEFADSMSIIAEDLEKQFDEIDTKKLEELTRDTRCFLNVFTDVDHCDLPETDVYVPVNVSKALQDLQSGTIPLFQNDEE